MTDRLSFAAGRMNMPQFVQLDLWADRLVQFDNLVSPDLSNAPELLTYVPLAAFGAALLRPEVYFPRSHVFLPKMAPDLIQNQWTGSNGPTLLEQSVAFVSHVVTEFGGPEKLKSAQVLDFGIGWGRLARLFLKYIPPHQLDGCDAWEKSLELAKECGLRNKLIKSDAHLKTLPNEASSYDLIYAFSVFTHLSEPAFHNCLSGFRELLKPHGKAIFTVRPNLFWTLRPDVQNQAALLVSKTFEFIPSTGLTDFGDTSVSADWLESTLAAAGLRLVRFEWSPVDALQVIAVTERA